MRKIFELAGTIAINGLENVNRNLRGLEKDLRGVQSSLGKAGRLFNQAGMELSKNFTVPIIAAGAGVAALTVKFGNYADRLKDLEQITGLSTDTLQEFEHVAREAGVDFNGLVTSIGKFTKRLPELKNETGYAYEAIRNLGIDIYDTSGNVRDMNVLFPELIKGLQGVDNIAERNSMSQEIFGRSLEAMAPVLGMAAEELEAARKKAHELGLVMDGDAIDAADNYRVSVETLQAQFTVLFRRIASELIPLLQNTFLPIIRDEIIPVFYWLVGRVKDAVDWFGGLDSQTRRSIITIVAFVAAIGPALIVIGQVSVAVKGLIGSFFALRGAIVAVTALITANPFGLAIVAAGALGTAILGAKKEYDDLTKAHQKFTIITTREAAIKSFTEDFEALKKEMMGVAPTMAKASDANMIFNERITELAKRASDLKYKINTINPSFKELQKVAQQMSGTMSFVDGKFVKAGEDIDETTDKTKKYIEKTKEAMKIEEDYAQKVSLFGLSKLAELEEQRKAAVAAAVKDGASTAAIERYYAMQRIEIEKDVAEEAEKTRAENLEKLAGYKKSELDITRGLSDRVIEQIYSEAEILQHQMKKELSDTTLTEEQKALIRTYYENKIADLKENNSEKETSLLSQISGKWMTALSAVGNLAATIFSAATNKKTQELEAWEEKEVASIENSTMSEKKKREQLEKLDVEAGKKRKEMQKKTAKDNKAAATFQSIISTAAAVVGALSNQPWSVANFVLAGIVGGLGAIQTAIIASQPVPLAKGGVVPSTAGGVPATLAEGGQDEMILPLETGVRSLSEKLVENIKAAILPDLSRAMFFNRGEGGGGGRELHLHVGTLVADDRGIKELERRLSTVRIQETNRVAFA
jgi:uncharacterized coiled-coil protein SlyX